MFVSQHTGVKGGYILLLKVRRPMLSTPCVRTGLFGVFCFVLFLLFVFVVVVVVFVFGMFWVCLHCILPKNFICQQIFQEREGDGIGCIKSGHVGRGSGGFGLQVCMSSTWFVL